MSTQSDISGHAPLVTSHRLYNATPQATGAWAALFTRAFRELGLDVRTVTHAWPQPLSELWQRSGLCAAFMCGWPYAKAVAGGGGMQAIAAPVPAFPAYSGLPRYRSEFLVRADSGWARLEDTFGRRYGWMVNDSQSGWNGPRWHLAQYASPRWPTLFGEVRGPYGNPRRSIEALRNGEIDVTALDSFYLDLIRADDNGLLDGLRTIEVTAWVPLPLLIAASDVDLATVDRLRMFLTGLHQHDEWRPLLAAAKIERFDLVNPASYLQLLQMEQDALQRGYAVIQ